MSEDMAPGGALTIEQYRTIANEAGEMRAAAINFSEIVFQSGYAAGAAAANARWQEAVEATLRNHAGREPYDEGWRDALDIVQVRALGEEAGGE